MTNRTPPLDAEQRQLLLELARAAIAARMSGRPSPAPEVPEGPLTELRGAFVTLTIDHHLRGCIGHVVGVEPLWSSVRSNALAAAFEDPRFPPLELVELDRVAIEVSALSPLQPAADPTAIEIGRDGLLIECGRARGLLLPQVATEHGWDRTTFLEQLCRKAGLDRDAWRRADARLSTFTVDSFSEE